MKLSPIEARAIFHVPVELREKFVSAHQRLKRENSLGALEGFRSVVMQIKEKRK